MKKTMIVVAVAGLFAASAAQAKSSLNLYGSLDTSLSYTTGLQNVADIGVDYVEWFTQADYGGMDDHGLVSDRSLDAYEGSLVAKMESVPDMRLRRRLSRQFVMKMIRKEQLLGETLSHRDKVLEDLYRGKRVDNRFEINSGEQSGSYIGIKGVEDLGNGLKAKFTLETGIMANSGRRDPKMDLQPASFFNRKSVIGLAHDKYGDVSVGLQSDLTRQFMKGFTLEGNGLSGVASGLPFDIDNVLGTARMPNSIKVNLNRPDSNWRFAGMMHLSNTTKRFMEWGHAGYGIAGAYHKDKLKAAISFCDRIQALKLSAIGLDHGSNMTLRGHRMRTLGFGMDYDFGPVQVSGVMTNTFMPAGIYTLTPEDALLSHLVALGSMYYGTLAQKALGGTAMENLRIFRNETMLYHAFDKSTPDPIKANISIPFHERVAHSYLISARYKPTPALTLGAQYVGLSLHDPIPEKLAQTAMDILFVRSDERDIPIQDRKRAAEKAKKAKLKQAAKEKLQQEVFDETKAILEVDLEPQSEVVEHPDPAADLELLKEVTAEVEAEVDKEEKEELEKEEKEEREMEAAFQKEENDYEVDVKKDDTYEVDVKKDDTYEVDVKKDDTYEVDVKKDDTFEVDVKKDDTFEVDVKKDDTFEVDVKKDDTFEVDEEKDDDYEVDEEKDDTDEVDVKKDDTDEVDVKKDDTYEVDVKKDDTFEVDAKKDDTYEVDVKKDDTYEVDVKKDDTFEVDVKKDDTYEVDVKKDDTFEVDVKKDDTFEVDAKKDDDVSTNEATVSAAAVQSNAEKTKVKKTTKKKISPETKAKREKIAQETRENIEKGKSNYVPFYPLNFTDLDEEDIPEIEKDISYTVKNALTQMIPRSHSFTLSGSYALSKRTNAYVTGTFLTYDQDKTMRSSRVINGIESTGDQRGSVLLGRPQAHHIAIGLRHTF